MYIDNIIYICAFMLFGFCIGHVQGYCEAYKEIKE